MAFRGWPIEAVEFYEGLEADNSKVYWTERRAVYDRHVKAPMEELLAELAEQFGADKLFRPHVRFSADKLPYKTNCAKTWPVGAWLGTAKAKDRVVTALRAGAPPRQWLARNVG
jgi:uncharacterized protein (DUF2461 family)